MVSIIPIWSEYKKQGKMKITVLNILILILTTTLHGQEIKISVAPTANTVFYYRYPHANKGTPQIGFNAALDYLFVSDNKFEFGFGFGYKYGQADHILKMYLDTDHSRIVKLNLLSISLKSVYNFKRDFYLSLDPTLDLNVGYDSQETVNETLQSFDSQTGLGLSFGFGKKFKINDALFINTEPRLWIHNIIRFHEEKIGARLVVAGLNFGLVFGQK